MSSLKSKIEFVNYSLQSSRRSCCIGLQISTFYEKWIAKTNDANIVRLAFRYLDYAFKLLHVHNAFFRIRMCQNSLLSPLRNLWLYFYKSTTFLSFSIIRCWIHRMKIILFVFAWNQCYCIDNGRLNLDT